MEKDLEYYAQTFQEMGFYDKNMSISDVVKELEAMTGRLKECGAYDKNLDILEVMDDLMDIAMWHKYGAYNVKKENERMKNTCHAEGLEKGRKEVTLEVASKMKEDSLDSDLIECITGLSHEEIENL